MRRFVLVLLSFCLIPAAVAAPISDRNGVLRAAEGRHMILEPEHTLTPAELTQLAAEGVEVRQPLTNGRYLVRLRPSARFDASDLRVRSLRPLDAAMKIDRTARRSVARLRYPELNIVFHDDVPLEEARTLILAAGGSLSDPLETRFGIPHLLRAHVPSHRVEALASDERVLEVRAPFRLRVAPDNSVAAAMSNVTTVNAAPYDLTGKDVVVSIFEVGRPDTHNDFGDRLNQGDSATCTPSTDSDCTSNVRHATHVTGTIIGSGAGDARAKGMAPAARVFSFLSSRGPSAYYRDKQVTLPARGVVADNNSWGYVLGWNYNGSDWVWEDSSIYFGGYDSTVTAPTDKIVRENNVLFVHSSGNNGDNFGPGVTPYEHLHVDEDLEPIKNEIYCYSQNGSGNDCPAPCTPGPKTCEVVRHEVNAPYLSVGVTASAKNILAVGSIDEARNITGYSSRGPARDGRVKPDVVARGGGGAGSGVLSTIPGNSYGRSQGTSMASPVVTGVAALLTEQWRRLSGGVSPGAMLLKSVIIAGADDLGTPGPDYTYGFGLVNAKASADLMRTDANAGRRIRSGSVATGARVEMPLFVSTTQTLRVVVTWADPEVLIFDEETDLAPVALVNDLDLKVVGPDGAEVLAYVLEKATPSAAATRGVNKVDNTEMVEVRNAAPGTYTAVLSAKINDNRQPTQPYVLVANAEIGASAPPCVDVHEPNDTAETGYGLIPSNQTITGRTCTASDVDFYRYRLDTTGIARVVVTAGDTALNVSFAGTTQSTDVPANSTRTLEFTYSTLVSPPPRFPLAVRVAPVGTIGPLAEYTITASLPTISGPRRRTAR